MNGLNREVSTEAEFQAGRGIWDKPRKRLLSRTARLCIILSNDSVIIVGIIYFNI